MTSYLNAVFCYKEILCLNAAFYFQRSTNSKSSLLIIFFNRKLLRILSPRILRCSKVEAATPIRLRKLKSPFTMTDSSIRKGSSKQSWLNFVFRIFTPMILVIFIAYFPEKPPAGFVCRSFLTKSWEIIYLLVTGIVVCYGLFGRRSDEKNEGTEISSDRLSMAYFAEIFNVDCVSDFGLDHGYADGGMSGNALMTRLGDEWLGLPVRSLKSLEDKGVKRGDGGFCRSRERFGSGSNCCEGVCEERNMAFGDLSPLNLLEKFNEASVLLSPIC